jgi:DNA-binding transcriptional ArsR family regulator
MARAATTADAFNAVAEPRRRAILDVLAGGERPVNDLVRELGVTQPQVSKHLRVLSEAGLVQVRPVAQQRIYGLRAEGLKELDDWLEGYRRLWGERFEQLDDVLSDLQQEKGKTNGNRK